MLILPDRTVLWPTLPLPRKTTIGTQRASTYTSVHLPNMSDMLIPTEQTSQVKVNDSGASDWTAKPLLLADGVKTDAGREELHDNWEGDTSSVHSTPRLHWSAGGRHTRMRWERGSVKPQRHALTTRNLPCLLFKGKSSQTETKKTGRKNLGQTSYAACDTHDIGIDYHFRCKTLPDRWNTKKWEQNWAGVKCHAAEMNGKRGRPKWKTSQQQVRG